MKNAIILHGGPSRDEYYDPKMPSMSNSHWMPWLQAQLLKKDIPTATPEVFRSFDRNWSVWSKEVERYDINQETTLIGHSTGAGFFIKYLSIHPDLKVDRLILIAPWLDPDHTKTVNFFDDFEIDPEIINRVNQLVIWYSSDDEDSILETVAILKEKIPNAKYRKFEDYGHFCENNLKSKEFPELLELLIN